MEYNGYLSLIYILSTSLVYVVCKCPVGYYKVGNEKTCRDVDECSPRNRECGQLCSNTPGSFRCGCLNGYVLGSDRRSCQVDGERPILYFRQRKDIAMIDPAGLYPASYRRKIGNVRSFDIHQATGDVYWIDGRTQRIGITNNISETQEFTFNELWKPETIKIDWISDHIYWTDSKAKWVMRCSLNGSDPYQVLTTNRRRPKALVLDPFDRFMFWSTTGRSERIERADFDGSTRSTIVKTGLNKLVSLDLDFADKRVYWLDQMVGTIESIAYNGKSRSLLVEGLSPESTGLSLLADSVYWLEADHTAIYRASRRTGQQEIRLRSDFFQRGQSNLVVMHPSKQPSQDPRFYNGQHCVTWNNCLTFPHNRQVDLNKPFLIFVTNDTVRRINQDGTDYSYIITEGVQNLVDVDYVTLDRKIYFADAGRGVIESANDDGSGRDVIVSKGIGQIEGLAIDFMHRRIYWTDSSMHKIASTSLTGGRIQNVADENVDQPRGIAVHASLNLIYWTDIGNLPRISVCSQDGSFRANVIAEDLLYPHGLTIDHKQKKLYWVDFGYHVIEKANMDGTGREVVYRVQEGASQLQQNFQPYSLAVFGDFVWYSNWEDDMVVRVSLETEGNLMDIRGDMHYPSGIRAIDPEDTTVQVMDPCDVFNGMCDHICTHAHINQVVCSCTPGYRLEADSRSCSLANACESGEHECGFHSKCNKVDRNGGYFCICEEGYQSTHGNGTNCSISRPCDVDNGNCEHVCINARTTPVCSCNPGYWLEADRRSCSLANACEANTHRCGAHSFCISNNTNGGYLCACDEGYQHIGDSFNCTLTEIHVPLAERVGTIINQTSTSRTSTTEMVATMKSTIGTTNAATSTMQANHTYNTPTVRSTTRLQSADGHLTTCPEHHAQHYCLNGGTCIWVIAIDEPSCHCTSEYDGSRCAYVYINSPTILIIRLLPAKWSKEVKLAVSWSIIILPMAVMLVIIFMCLLCCRAHLKKSKSKETDSSLTVQQRENQCPAVPDVYNETSFNENSESSNRSDIQHPNEPSAPPSENTNCNSSQNNSNTTFADDLKPQLLGTLFIPGDTEAHLSPNPGYVEMRQQKAVDATPYMSMMEDVDEDPEYINTSANHNIPIKETTI